MAARFAGYSLYVKDRRLIYVHNYLGLSEYRITSDEEIPSGRITLALRFDEDRRTPGPRHPLLR